VTGLEVRVGSLYRLCGEEGFARCGLGSLGLFMFMGIIGSNRV
jgi:hypothetical protein